MVAVVSGSGLGLFNSSRSTLGMDGSSGDPAVGRGNDRTYVNSTNGNLVIQSVDDTLSARGLDTALVRTYNSQGLVDGDNDDGWRIGFYRRVVLSGALNSADSIVTKTFGDGAEIVYRYDGASGKYISTDGDGAHDTLSFASNQWTWTDGASGASETYDANGQLESERDVDNNTIQYTYTGSLLTQVVDASGQTTFLEYTGNNLTSVRVVSNGQQQTHTRYTYDSQNRLIEVDVEGQYATTYRYVGTTNLIAETTQRSTQVSTVIASQSFTYEFAAGMYRVKTVTDAAGHTTTFNYTLTSNSGAAAATTASANPGVLHTTDTQQTPADFPRNNSALTTPAAGWGTAGLLETANGAVIEPKVAFDSNGNGFAVWAQGGDVFARRYTRVNDTWAAAVTLDSNTNTTSSPTLAIDGAGNAVVAWSQSNGTAVSAYGITYSATSGAWGTAALLESTTLAVATTAYSMNASISGSQAAVAFLQTDGTRNNAYVARWSGGAWSGATLVEASTNAAAQPSVAVDGQGNVSVVFQQSNGTANSIYVNRFTASSSTWSGATLLETSNTAAIEPKIAFDSNGNGFAVWSQGPDVFARRYTRSTNTWAAAVTLDSNGNTTSSPALAVDAGGNAVAAWSQSNGTAVSAYAAVFNAGTGTWGAATLIESTNLAVATTAYSMSADIKGSRAAVAWLQTDGTRNNAYVSTWNGSAWSGAGLVEARTNVAAQPTVAIDSLGNAAVAIQQSDGTANSIYVNRFIADTTPYYLVGSNSTWQGIANAVYGINSSAAGDALAAQLSGQSLAAGNRLTGFPPTLTVNVATTVTVPAYYIALATDDWASVTQAVYGTRDANAILALQGATGVTTLSTDLHLTVPLSLRYTPTGQISIPAGNSAVSTVDNVTTSTDYALLTGALSNGATVGWSAPQDFEGAQYPVLNGSTLVRLNDSGDGMAVWSDNYQMLYRRFSAATQTWGPVSVLASVSNRAYSGDLAVDSAGNAVASWMQWEQNSSTFSTYVSTFSAATGVWSTANPLAINGVVGDGSLNRTVAISNGHAAVAYTVNASDHVDLYVARNLGSGWSAGQLVETFAGNVGSPALTMDPAGNIAVGFTVYDSGRYQFYVNRWEAASGAPTGAIAIPNIASYQSVGAGAQLLSDAQGNLLAAWQLGVTLMTARYDVASGTWQPEQAFGTNVYGARLAMNAAGDAAVLYQLATGMGQPLVFSRLDHATGSWSLPEAVVADANYLTSTVGLELSAHGAVAAWQTQDPMTGHLNVEFRILVNGSWTDTKDLGSTSSNGRPSVAIDGSGDVEVLSAYGSGYMQLHEMRYSAPAYIVPANSSWRSVANTLYGVDSDAAGDALRLQLGDPTFAAGLRLVNLPQRLTVKTTSVATVPAYYVVQAGDTWSSIAQAVYGSADTTVAAALRRVLGDPVLTTGLHLTVPSTLDSGSETIYLQTDVTDALGERDTYVHDIAGRLFRHLSPDVDGTRIEDRFEYDSAGNLVRVTRDVGGLNRVTDLGYDARGNLTSSRDSLGDTLVRTYDSSNQLLTEVRYTETDPDGVGPASPSGAMTTHFVRGSDGRLRFVISPEGRVTEYQNNGFGQVVQQSTYTNGIYAGNTFSESDLAVWAYYQDAASVETTNFQYDFRGNVNAAYRFRVPGDWNSVASTYFEYDQRGRLTRTDTPIGSAFTGIYGNQARTWLNYDLFGNITNRSQTIDSYSPYDQVTYDYVMNGSFEVDGQGYWTVPIQPRVTLDHFNNVGELVSRDRRAYINNNSVEDITTYAYDGVGRLRMTTDSLGQRHYFIYDSLGHKIGDIDAAGRLTQFVFDHAGEVIKTIQYSSFLAASTLASLVDANGNPAAVSIDMLVASLASVPGRDASKDQIARAVYDAAGRLVFTIDATGAVTETRYDGAGRVTGSTSYANRVSIPDGVVQVLPAQLATGGTYAISPDPLKDRITRNFYDTDGNLLGTLDAEGYLSENRYNSAGHLIEQVRWANPTTVSLRATGTLDQLRPAPDLPTDSDDPESDIHSYFLYDVFGRQVGAVDGEGYLTETVYDLANNVASVIRYEKVVTVGASSTLDSLRAGATGINHVTSYLYDGKGRVVQETNYEGTVTRTQYDPFGGVLSRTTAYGTSEARTTQSDIDGFGQVAHELTAEGSAAIAAGMSSYTAWQLYGVTHLYDTAHRLIATINQNGGRTLYYYDESGRVRFTVLDMGDGTGEIAEARYNALGQQTTKINYTNRISTASLNGGTVDGVITARAAAAFDSQHDLVVTTTYKRNGLIESVTTSNETPVDTDDARTSYDYDAFGDVTAKYERIDATRLREHSYDYDRRGLQTFVAWEPATVNQTQTSEYDAFGRLTKVTDQYGNQTRTEYDRLGRVVKTYDALNHTTSTSYDAFSRVLTTTDALQQITSYAYDDLARSITITTPEGIIVTTVHNRYGQTLTVTDSRGVRAGYEYDANGQQKRQYDSQGDLETRLYDRAGRLTDSTDANGVITHFAYDAANRVLTRTQDYGGLALQTIYEYDGQGRVRRVTEPGGRITDTTYYADGHVRDVAVDPSGLNLVTHYTYDLAGNVLTVTEYYGSALPRTTEYHYDDLGRRTDEVVDPTDLGGTLNLRTQYRYDRNGNVTRRIDSRGNSIWYVYDAAGRRTHIVDSTGSVTETNYDDDGRVTLTRTHVATLSAAQLAAFADADRPTATEVTLAADALDRRTYSFYDRDGREKYSIDGRGVVTQRSYDDRGNVTRTRVLSGVTLTGGYAGIGAVETALGAARDNLAIADRVSWTAYDERDRAQIVVDSTDGLVGSVRRITYDNLGNVIATRAYATARPLSLPADIATLRDWTDQHAVDDDQLTLRWVDSLSRERFTLDPEGYLTEMRYDDNARSSTRISYHVRPQNVTLGTAIGAVAQAASAAGAVDPGKDQVSTTWADVTGRARFALDAEGYLTETQYNDNTGATTVIAYASRPNSIAAGATSQQVSAARVLAPGRDRSNTTWVDAAGRKRFTLDAENYLVETRYDDATGARTVTVYANPQGFTAATTLQTLLQPNAILLGEDQSTRTEVDAADRIVHVVDALQKSEYYSYDGAGDKRSYTNKLGATAGDAGFTWTYTYDAAGNLLTETTPVVDVYSVTDNGSSLSVGSATSMNLVTKFDYDFQGHVTKRYEAFGTAQQRVTSYEYDALGRQVRTYEPAVSVFDPSGYNQFGAAGSIAITEYSRTMVNEVSYDALGNAYRSRRVSTVEMANPDSGTFTFKTYDHLGRIELDVDAMNDVTRHLYDAFGNETDLVSYAQPLAARPLVSGNTLRTRDINVQSSAADRLISKDYDRRNLVVAVRLPQLDDNVVTAKGGAASAPFTGQPLTTSQYNAFGELVLSRRLVGPALNVTEDTYTYYDRRGLKSAEIDPGKFLTRYDYDQSGNLRRQREAANAVTGAITTDSYALPQASAPAPGAQPDNGFDRDTEFFYDRLNRLTGQVEHGVQQSYFDGQILQTKFDDVLVSYGYDALGNRTSVTDANSQTAFTYYDVLGRVVGAADVRRDLGNNTHTVPFTRMLLDAHGDALEQIQYANAFGENGVTRVLPTSFASSADDRITVMEYDAAGHVVRSQDPTGALRFASYGENGLVAKEWQKVVNPQDLNTSTDDLTSYLVTEYHYNARNELIDSVQPVSLGAAPTVRHTITRYNAFGEVTSRGTDTNGLSESGQEFFEYDNAGRVWRTNSGDGVVKVNLYDLAGRVTVELRAQGIDLKTGATTPGAAPVNMATLQDVLARYNANIADDGFMRTETAYDYHGNVVERRMPSFTVADGMQQAAIDAQIGVVLAGSLDVFVYWSGALSPNTEAHFKYRVKNSGAGWQELQVVTLPDGHLGADVMDLANKEYEFLVTMNRAGSTSNFAETSGSFHVDREQDVNYLVLQDGVENVDIGGVSMGNLAPAIAGASYNGTAVWDASVNSWHGENVVSLSVPDIGQQPVEVTVFYTDTTSPRGDEGYPTSFSKVVTPGPGGLYELRWSEPVHDSPHGGIYPWTVSGVVIKGESTPGNFDVLIASSTPQPARPYMLWDLPNTTGLTARVHFKSTGAGSFGSWITPDKRGLYYSVDVEKLLLDKGDYNYEIEYLRGTQVVARKGGVLHSEGQTYTREFTGGSLGEVSFNAYHDPVDTPRHDGTRLTWAPEAGVDASFTYTPSGGTAQSLGINQQGNPWYVDLGFLGSDATGTYTITYTIGGHIVAQASGSYHIKPPSDVTTTNTTPQSGNQPADVPAVGTVNGFNGVASASGYMQGTAGWNDGIHNWVNQNQVQAGWVDVGSQSIVVRVDYTKITKTGQPANNDSFTSQPMVAPNGALIGWSDPPGDIPTGGIWIGGNIVVSVYGRDASGNYTILLRRTGGTGSAGAPTVSWSVPNGSNVTARYYVDGVERTVGISGNTRTVDLSGLSIGNHTYQIDYIRPNDSQAIVYQTGTVYTNGNSTQIIGTPTNYSRNPSWVVPTQFGSAIRWTHAVTDGWPQGISGAATVTFRYQDNQGTWHTVTPSTSDNIHYTYDFYGQPSGPYPYEIIYKGAGDSLPFAYGSGTVNVGTRTDHNVADLELGSPSLPTDFQAHITTASLSDDRVSWNWPKRYGSSDIVRFSYVFNGHTYSTDLAGDGPSFSAAMSEVTRGDFAVDWSVEYFRAGESYAYARTSGTAQLHISGTPVDPVITTVDEYQLPVVGLSPIDRPILLPDGFLGWTAPLANPATDVVKFFYNGTQEVTAVPNGSGWKVDLRNLPEATYSYLIEYRTSPTAPAYVSAHGTFTVSHPFGVVTGFGRTVDGPRPETVPTPSITFETTLTPHPPQAYWSRIEPYQDHFAFIPVVNTAAGGGGWIQTVAPSTGNSQGQYELVSNYSTSNDKQLVLGSVPTGDVITFEYAPASAPQSFTSIPVYAITGSRPAVNINSLSGAYRFRITLSRAGAPGPYVTYTGDFNATSNTFSFDPNAVSQPQRVTPTLSQSFDRWGNVIGIQDAAGNITGFRYNQHNQLVDRIEAPVNVLSTVPVVETTSDRPEYLNFFDKGGRLIMTRDANGNESQNQYNEAGQLLWVENADAGRYGGATAHYAYDAFGDTVRFVDQLGYETRTVYDHAGRQTQVVKEIDAGTLSDVDTRSVDVAAGQEIHLQRQSYAYDEAGRKIRETNGESETTRYAYDLVNDLTVQTTPLGYAMHYTYDVNGRKTSEIDAILTESDWTYDYFGRLTDHIGKHTLQSSDANLYGSGGDTNFDYHYNYAGLVDYQVSDAGMRVSYAYDEAGQLSNIIDIGVNRLTSYVYDSAGRHVRERVTIDGLVHQDTRTTYDTHNRISNLNDPDYRVTYSYDRNGNRTEIAASYANEYGNTVSQTLYYTYDEMNRVVISQGTLFGNPGLQSVDVTTAQGIEIKYNARGERESAKTKGDRWSLNGSTYTATSGVLTSEYYHYDGLGRLTTVEKETVGAPNNRSVVRAMEYDRADRATRETDYFLEGQTRHARETVTQYDDNGRAIGQTTRKDSIVESAVHYGNNGRATFANNQYGARAWTAGYDDAGNLRGYDVDVYNPDNNQFVYVNQFRNYYTFGESYLLNTQEAVPDRTGQNIPLHGTTYRLYNVDEELSEYRDSSSTAQDQWRMFANNQSGQALTTIQEDFNPPGAIKTAWEYAIGHSSGGSALKVQHFFLADGNAVGSFGQLSPDSPNTFTANFDVNYTPVSASYPAASPSTVIAMSGDTARTIAVRLYGDGNLWYLIAEENLLSSPDQAIQQGAVVRVPNKVVSLANTWDVFKPFDPTRVLGGGAPTQAAPPPAKLQCQTVANVIGIVVGIIVGVVVSIFATPFVGAVAGAAAGETARQYALLIGNGMYDWNAQTDGTLRTLGLRGNTLDAIKGLVVGTSKMVSGEGAIEYWSSKPGSASPALSLLNNGPEFGAQGKFDPQSVLISAGAAAASYGASYGATEYLHFNGLGSAVAGSLAASATTYGLNRAFGREVQMSWRDVAVSALAAAGAYGAGRLAGHFLKGSSYNEADKSFLTHLAQGAGSASVRLLIDGHVDVASVLVDIFGNALADSYRDQVTSSQSERKMEQEQAEAFAASYMAKHSGSLDKLFPIDGTASSSFDTSGLSDLTGLTGLTGLSGLSDLPPSDAGTKPTDGSVSVANGNSLLATASNADSELEEIVVTGYRRSADGGFIGGAAAPGSGFSFSLSALPPVRQGDVYRDGIGAFDDFEHLFRSRWIGASPNNPVPDLLPGAQMIPVGAVPLSGLEDNMSLLARALSKIGLTDKSNSIYATISLPEGSDYDGLREMLNSAMQLKPGISLADFQAAAAQKDLHMGVQVNGILNSYWQSVGNGTAFATEQTMAGQPTFVVNIYNPTASAFRDSVETALEDWHLNTAAVAAVEMEVTLAAAYNRKVFGLDAQTSVFAHSQGTAISNEAVGNLSPTLRSSIELYNIGTATGNVPFGLAKYRSIQNILDPVPTVVSNIAGGGGVATSPGYIAGKIAGRDYAIFEVDFDVANNHANHSLSPYFSNEHAREGLGFVPLTSWMHDLYLTGAWVKGK